MAVERARARPVERAVAEHLPPAGQTLHVAVGGDVLDVDRQHRVGPRGGGEELGVDRAQHVEVRGQGSGLPRRAHAVVERVVLAGRDGERARGPLRRRPGAQSGDRDGVDVVRTAPRRAAHERAGHARRRRAVELEGARLHGGGHPALSGAPAAADLVVGHGLDVGGERRVGHSADVAVHPPQHELVHGADVRAGQVRGRGLEVRPGAEQEAGGHAVGAQALVEHGLAALEQVVLAADDEGRDLDLVDDVEGGAHLVERAVVGLAVSGQCRADDRPLERGRALHVREQRGDAAGRVRRGVRRRRESGAGDETQPQRDEADVDLASGGDHVAIDVARRHDREHRLEPGRVLGGGEELVDRAVGHAVEPDPAVAPRAGRGVGPLDDLLAVELLARPEGRPLPVGAARAAHVGDDLHVAALDEVLVGEVQPRRVLVVRRLGHDHREASGGRGAVGLGRPQDVGAQDDAVAHPQRDVLRRAHGVRRRAGLPAARRRRGRGGRDGGGQAGQGRQGRPSGEQARGQGGSGEAAWAHGSLPGDLATDVVGGQRASAVSGHATGRPGRAWSAYRWAS